MIRAPKTFSVILEYCGGENTDRLYQRIAYDNPHRTIYVLDNASPRDRARCITHQNNENSFVGGGIKDCIKLAKDQQATYLFFIANNIEPQTTIDISYFEALLEADNSIVLASAALTQDSDKTRYYKWMVAQKESSRRFVKHADLLLCLLRLDFLDTFGGLPNSRSGYGFDFELAFQAKKQGRKIALLDQFVLRHRFASNKSKIAFQDNFNKNDEMNALYDKRFGNSQRILRSRKKLSGINVGAPRKGCAPLKTNHRAALQTE